MIRYPQVERQLLLKLPVMDCLKTTRISAPCSVRAGSHSSDGHTHLVGTELYCARHCPVHEQGPRMAIAGEPERGVTENLQHDLVTA